VPAILFVVMHRRMHQLLTEPVRNISLAAFTIILLVYNVNNFMWNEPHLDFRPFKIGADIAGQKEIEMQAENNVEILAYKLTNKASKEVREIPYDQFLKEYANYSKEEWDYDQIQSEPYVWDTIRQGDQIEVVKKIITRTKISDFSIMDPTDNEVTEDILYDPNYNFLIVGYKTYTDEAYLNKWREPIGRLTKAAKNDGITSRAVINYADADALTAFAEATGIDYPLYKADDIMLKTIIRSNPGVLLLKNGRIVMKWHLNKLPDYTEIKTQYMR
jgi:hypothetical protein